MNGLHVVIPAIQSAISYTKFFLSLSVAVSETAGRNSCSIVSGDVSNCSYRLKALPLTSSRLSSA